MLIVVLSFTVSLLVAASKVFVVVEVVVFVVGVVVGEVVFVVVVVVDTFTV